MVEPLRDPVRFAKVTIEWGTIAWPDDGVKMPPEALYEQAVAQSGRPRRRGRMSLTSASVPPYDGCVAEASPSVPA